jgi:5-methylcytosine-specific restriction endonuclease McrA
LRRRPDFHKWREEHPQEYQKRLARFRKWREQNREAHNRKAKESMACIRAADPKKYNAYMREYCQNALPEQRQKRIADMAAYYQTHKPESAERGRRWAADNIEQERIRAKNKAAWRRKAIGKYSLSDIEALYSNQKGKCAICALVFPQTGTHRFEIDHIIPLRPPGAVAPVGTNNPDNLQLLCRKCNRLKWNHLPGGPPVR